MHHNSKKTHCPAGHEYSQSNTYVWKGTRRCLVCQKQWQMAYYYRNVERKRAITLARYYAEKGTY